MRERARAARCAPALPADSSSARPFVYFPLHVVDDYKIKRVIPHCYDQASIIEHVADALPHGYDVVLKEHPMSIGRNRLALLRRLRARFRTSRLVAAAHELARADDARRRGRR